MVLERALPHMRVLSELATELNEVSDRYKHELKVIEAALQRMNLDLEVCLERPLTQTQPKEVPKEEIREVVTYHHALRLGYGKDRGASWRLLVYHYEVIEDEDGGRAWRLLGTIPLLNASRALRLSAADQILDLLSELGKAAKKKIDALQRVNESVSRNGISSTRIQVRREASADDDTDTRWTFRNAISAASKAIYPPPILKPRTSSRPLRNANGRA
ncbi:MAG: hypothetical protein ACE5G5_02685 [Candidatus Methylomirabilales bacterium]